MKTVLWSAYHLVIVAFPILLTAQPYQLWDAEYGGAAAEVIRDIVQMPDGGYLMLGSTESYGQGFDDVLVIRSDGSGVPQNLTSFGGLNYGSGQKILPVDDSTYILIADTSPFSESDKKILFIKANSHGDTLSTRVLDGFYAGPIIRSGCTATDGYLILGHWHAVEGVNPAIFALKINADGDTLWCQQYRMENISVQAADVVAMDDGGFAILGIIPNEEMMDNDTWLIRTDAMGDTLWTKSYSLAPRSIDKTASGEFIIGGSVGAAMEGDQPALMKVDTAGAEVWTTPYGVMWEYYLYDHLVDSRNEIVMLGEWINDLWIAKTDSLGQLLWSERYGGNNPEHGIRLIETASGNYIAAGNKNIGGSDYQAWIMEVGYYDHPVITHLVDVPDDQGRRLEISWAPSRLDISGEISMYRIHVTDTENNWHMMDGVAATGQEPYYTHEISTFGDSSANHLILSKVRIEAVRTDQSPGYYSPIDSAYSIDNLAPPAPSGFDAVAMHQDLEIVLSWLPVEAADLIYVAVYQGATSGFDPTSGSPVAQVFAPDTSVVIADLTTDIHYYFRVAAVDTNGNRSDFSSEAAALLLGVNGDRLIPEAFELHSPFPNPFNPVTTLRYDLPRISRVSLIVYDVLGRKVKRLLDGQLEPGYHQLQWDGRNAGGREVPSGIYIARLVTPEYNKSIKMLLLK
jgi:hypothetical protein